MKRILRRRPTPAFVLAAVALFVALSGSAYALTVTGGNIRDGSITGADIRNRSVPGEKLRSRTLRGTLMQVDSVGNNAVKEEVLDAAKLKQVKSAESADAVNGLDVTPLQTFPLAPGQAKGVGNVGPFALTARCRIDGPKQIAEIVVQTNQSVAAVAGADNDPSFEIGEVAALARVEAPGGEPAFGRESGATVVARDGTQLVADLYAGVSVFGEFGNCRFGGVVYGI